MTLPPAIVSSGPVRVLLGSEQPLVRAGLRRLLASRPGLEVVADAGSAAALLRLAIEQGPDVAVLDRFPSSGVLDIVRGMRLLRPDIKVLLYDLTPGDVAIVSALQAGIRGFVDRQAGVDALASAILRVAAGELHISPPLVEELAEGRRGATSDEGLGYPAGPGSDPPTSRELDVLRRIAAG